jgi:Fur family zinc uptake transcriptional regulator
MRTKSTDISPQGKNILALLERSKTPMTAYAILDKLKIKAPTTVYRALDALVERGAAHRIESLNAFVACHSEHKEPHARFAVCRDCGAAVEIHDAALSTLIRDIGRKLHFHIEREMLELLGQCGACAHKAT